MSTLAVMYHYVRPEDPDHPELRALHVDDFRAQLDHLAASGRPLVPRHTFLDALRHRTPLPDGFVLTFDDGLADHVDHVLPELERRGWWGAFYVPTGPLATGRALDVHRIHAQLGAVGGAAVLDALRQVLADEDARATAAGRQAYATHHDDDDTLTVRRLLNYDVAPGERTRLLDATAAILGVDAEVDAWYASTTGLRRLVDAGMLLGAHSVSHRPMSQLDPADQQREVVDAFTWLEGALGLSDGERTFCYPYGGAETYDHHTIQALEGAGVLGSFAVIGAEITADDVAERPQELPRIDCCTLPFGRSRTTAR